MTKSELIKQISAETNVSVELASSICNKVFTIIQESLEQGSRVEIRGFGSFSVKQYAGYTGRNPKTGTSVYVESKRMPIFRAGKKLKDFINS